MVDFYIKPKKEPIKSDGKSSSYYDLVLSEKTKKFIVENGYVKTEHLIYDIFGNDFDFGNAFKSLVRAYGITQGGGLFGQHDQLVQQYRHDRDVDHVREIRLVCEIPEEHLHVAEQALHDSPSIRPQKGAAQ